jgi:hypothetical protein
VFKFIFFALYYNQKNGQHLSFSEPKTYDNEPKRSDVVSDFFRWYTDKHRELAKDLPELVLIKPELIG